MIWGPHCHAYPCPETDHIDIVLNDIQSRTVWLSRQDQDMATRIGTYLRQKAVQRQYQYKQFSDRVETDIQIEGVAWEISTCRYLGMEYDPDLNGFAKADLPGNIEVKGHARADYLLRIIKSVHDSRRVVMVVGQSIRAPIIMVGWINAGEGKAIGRWMNPRPDKPRGGFFGVEQDQLRSMSELKETLFQEHVIEEGFDK